MKLAGTYCITCSANGLRYDGSSVDVLDRLRHHRAALTRGKHHNRHLQRAWDKYGETAFTFSPLDVSEAFTLEDARRKEQLLLGYKWATGNKGFNQHPEACGGWVKGRPSPRKGKKTGIPSPKKGVRISEDRVRAMVKARRAAPYPAFLSPADERHEVENLSAFCRTHGLQVANVYSLMRGTLQTHKGWRIAKPFGALHDT